MIRGKTGGFSLLEVLIFSAISCFAIFCVAQFLNKPFLMQRFMASAETPYAATHAMDVLVNDLKEAVPGSLPWNVTTSTTPLQFTKPRVNPETGQYDPLLFAYGYEGPDNGPGALVRVVGSTPTVILEPIDPPSASAPMFEYNSALRMVIIDIRYHPAGGPPRRLVRRVALSR